MCFTHVASIPGQSWGFGPEVALWTANHWVPGSIPGLGAHVGWLFHLMPQVHFASLSWPLAVLLGLPCAKIQDVKPFTTTTTYSWTDINVIKNPFILTIKLSSCFCNLNLVLLLINLALCKSYVGNIGYMHSCIPLSLQLIFK